MRSRADLTDRAAVDRALAAHLCRCTGWATIREAAALVGSTQPAGSAERDLAAASRRAELEGGTPQHVGPDVALGGVMFTGKSGQGQSTLGVGYELWAITAAVVGGCSLAGGVGSIRGTVLGLGLIQIIIKGTGQVVRDFEFSVPWLRIVSEMPWLSPGWRTFAVKGIDSTQIEGLILGLVVVGAVAFNQRLRVRRG